MTEKLINLKGVIFWDGKDFQTVQHDFYTTRRTLDEMLARSDLLTALAIEEGSQINFEKARNSLKSLQKALDEGLA